jgi:DNA (cytosine-5)-methyltransferase 1
MATDDLEVLNLYAGIGGNRKRWADVDVTAIEWDEEKADVYRDHFPDDTVIVTDAHEYLLEHFDEFDFIWASPPCPTHSKMRKMFHQDDNPVYPDMKLYQEILFLRHTFDGDWVVENVEPYYEPLIGGQQRGRHLFWSNFYIPDIDIEVDKIKRQDWGEDNQDPDGKYGFDVTGYGFSPQEKRKILNNCVNPELGAHVLNAATKDRQATLPV